MRIEKLGNLVDLRQGLAINKANSHLVSTENKSPFKYPLLRIADMLSSTFEKFISSEVSSNVIVNPDDIIYTRTGQIGLVFRGQSGVVHNNSFIVTPVNVQIDRDYLFVILQSELVRKQAIKQAKNSVQPDITHEMFKNISIPLPTLSHQKKIANVILNIDQKIALNNQINQELEAMAKTLYDYWFVQFDFPDQNGKPYKSSGGKMVYNPELKREIPEGWGVEKLENIANITMGQSPKGTSYNEVGEGMLFFQGSTDFGWRFPVARQYTTEPSRIAEEDDILLSVRAPVGTLNIADTRCCIGRGLAAINSKVGANSYIFNVMQDFKKLFDMMNSVGTTFGSITKDDLYSLKLIYPPNELLMKFDKSVNSFDREIKNRSRQNQELSQLRYWLLPMLMNGQVKVEDKT